jgi:hypothetical protein
MRGWDPKMQSGTVKSQCLETKKGLALRQCVLNREHVGSHLFPVYYDERIIMAENARVEKELKAV